MTDRARWEKPVQDGAGNLVEGVWCEVRDANAEGTPLVSSDDMSSDRAAASPLSNPFFTATGVPFFYAKGGCYNVRIYKTGLDQTFYHQAVGTGAERDIAAGEGDVSGPDDSADGEIVVFDGIDGKKIKRGGLLSAMWATMTHALTSKATPVNADELGLIDSADSFAAKRLTMTNLKAFLKTYFDPIYGTGNIKSVNIQAFTSSGTYTPTSGMAHCIAFVTAGGGNGAASGSGNGSRGGGGGAGGTAIEVLTAANIGASQTVTVGSGGAVSGSANNGGSSSLGSLLSASGGAGLASGTNNGGLGGTSSGGNLNVTGGDGGSTADNSTSGGSPAGSGGASFWGGGGRPSDGGAGADGRAYGSGGSGGHADGAGAGRNGGAGAGGVVMIIEFIA